MRVLLDAGVNIHEALRGAFLQSYVAGTLYIDDELIALYGACGHAFSTSCTPWVALTDRAALYPVTITKRARDFLKAVMLTKTDMRVALLMGDETAHRFAIFLGFMPSGMEGEVISKSGRKTVLEALNEHGERFPIGRGFATMLEAH